MVTDCLVLLRGRLYYCAIVDVSAYLIFKFIIVYNKLKQTDEPGLFLLVIFSVLC